MWMKPRGSRVLLVLVLSAGLGCSDGVRPGPIGPQPTPVPTVSVRLEGMVVDDLENPVPGALVAVTGCHSAALCRFQNQADYRVTASDQGSFLLTVSLPQDWSELLLDVKADGYESTSIYVDPAKETSRVLRLYRTLTIRPGETIEIRTFLGSYVCAFESMLCRRILVDSPGGEPLDLEVTQIGGTNTAGLEAGPQSGHPFFPGNQPRVTVSGGEVWIFPSSVERTAGFSGVLGVFTAEITLTARPHR